MMDQGLQLGSRIIRKVAMSFSIVAVNTLSAWTRENMSLIQGLCLIALLFITAIHLSRKVAQPRLIRLICLLYCNQQIRRLFISGTDTAGSFFPNILLAAALAILLIAITDKDDEGSLEDLRVMLEGIMYMYGDIMDFIFEYGVLPVTVASFGVGLILRHTTEPSDPMKAFVRRLLGIISINLLYQGVTTFIDSPVRMKLVESIAATSIIRLVIPSMESYLVYLTAAQLTALMPGLAPVIACTIMWIELLPVSSRGWVGELFAVYVMQAVVSYLIFIPTWGAIVVLILAHYMDYISVHLNEA